MSDTSVDPAIIKKTQDTLGRIISKPSLTESRLKRPPIAFLQDIIKEVSFISHFKINTNI